MTSNARIFPRKRYCYLTEDETEAQRSSNCPKDSEKRAAPKKEVEGARDHGRREHVVI